MGGTLDFVVIGAQKAGTTSLWRLLGSHPELWLPSSKEAAFFHRDGPYETGLAWYLGEFFADAPASAAWGTVTPQYMMGTPEADVGEIARRMAHAIPGARLIALLRDPIERARSHHRMSVHRGLESRRFEEAAAVLLDPARAAAARSAPSELNSYLIQGEYARILSAYLDVFPASQLHIAFTSDLAERPADTLQGIFEHLGVDPTHRPPNPWLRDHIGGVGRRLDRDAEATLKRHLAEHVWPQTARPRDGQRAFEFWFLQWNVVPDGDHQPLAPELEQELRTYFAADGAALERLAGARLPWPTGEREASG